MTFAVPPGDLAGLSAIDRLRRLPPWGLFIIVLGLLAMLYVGYRAFRHQNGPGPQTPARSFLNIFAAPLHAQGSLELNDSTKASSPRAELKQDIMVGIVAVLAIVLLLTLGTVLWSKDTPRITVAGDILKTVLGFFIGVATSFLG